VFSAEDTCYSTVTKYCFICNGYYKSRVRRVAFWKFYRFPRCSSGELLGISCRCSSGHTTVAADTGSAGVAHRDSLAERRVCKSIRHIPYLIPALSLSRYIIIILLHEFVYDVTTHNITVLRKSIWAIWYLVQKPYKKQTSKFQMDMNNYNIILSYKLIIF